MNKRQQNIYERYLASTNYALYDCYKSWSKEKQKVFEQLYNLCIWTYKGLQFKIISYNANMFTIGFTYFRCDKKYFCYITKEHKESWRID